MGSCLGSCIIYLFSCYIYFPSSSFYFHSELGRSWPLDKLSCEFFCVVFGCLLGIKWGKSTHLLTQKTQKNSEKLWKTLNLCKDDKKSGFVVVVFCITLQVKCWGKESSFNTRLRQINMNVYVPQTQMLLNKHNKALMQ